MCGIVGFTGNNEAAPILLDGLSKLEYRGYDSAGIAVRNGDAEPEIVKAKGKLKVLKEMTNDGKAVKGACGIGHTRWATHGEPSTVNAHPHCSDDENVIAVHNGIIENYQELREKLIKKGYTFKSETDTEVAVKLIDYYYKKYLGTPVDALNHALVRIRGSYALAVMFKDYPGEIYAARKDSPMIIGVTGGESYLASDVPAILKYTRNVYYIGNMELAKLTKGAVAFYNLDGEEIQKEMKTIEWDAEAAEKSGYEHFMLKEIHEQPKVIKDTINSVLADGNISFESVGLSDEDMKNIQQVYIVACGSAYHVGKVARNVDEELSWVSVRVALGADDVLGAGGAHLLGLGLYGGLVLGVQLLEPLAGGQDVGVLGVTVAVGLGQQHLHGSGVGVLGRFGAEQILAEVLLAHLGFRHELGVAAQHDIGTTACHVGGDGDGTLFAGLRHDLSLALVVLGVQHIEVAGILLQHHGESLALLDAERTHQNRQTILLALHDLQDDRVVLAVDGLPTCQSSSVIAIVACWVVSKTWRTIVVE